MRRSDSTLFFDDCGIDRVPCLSPIALGYDVTRDNPRIKFGDGYDDSEALR
jgi:hypothetical protein